MIALERIDDQFDQILDEEDRPASIPAVADPAHARRCWRDLLFGDGPLWIRFLRWSCRNGPR